MARGDQVASTSVGSAAIAACDTSKGWLAALVLGLLSVFAVSGGRGSQRTQPGVHAHACACGWRWSHDDSQFGDPAAHTCARCGALVWEQAS